MDVPILLNRKGGSVTDETVGAIEAAFRAAGLSPDVHALSGGDLTDKAAELAKSGTPIIAAAGGDGTQSAVAGALAGSDTALAVLPLGTLNHLARDLGIPNDLEEAAAIVAAGKMTRIDLGEVNGRTFVNNAAIGLYPLLVRDREGQQKRLHRSKKFAMLVAAAHTLVRFHHRRLHLTIDGKSEGAVETPLLFVGNNRYNTGFPRAGQRDRLDRGSLDLVVMNGGGRFAFFQAMVTAFVRNRAGKRLECLGDAHEIEVATRQSDLWVGLDGEAVELASPLCFRALPGALKVVVPSGD